MDIKRLKNKWVPAHQIKEGDKVRTDNDLFFTVQSTTSASQWISMRNGSTTQTIQINFSDAPYPSYAIVPRDEEICTVVPA